MMPELRQDNPVKSGWQPDGWQKNIWQKKGNTHG